MLCCCGLDLPSIAPDAFAIARELVPSAAAALFLTDHEGEMQASIHEDCPESVRQLCLEGGELFEGPTELNTKQLVAGASPRKFGQLLAPPAEYFSSNTYQLLVRGCGHHHTLDARLELDGRRFGLLALFREQGVAFDTQDLAKLSRIAQHFEHARRAALPPAQSLDDCIDKEAMLVARSSGELLFVSPSARELLDEIPLASAAWPDRRVLPPACLALIERLRDSDGQADQMPACTIALAGGVLEMRAHWLGAAADGGIEAARAAADGGMVGIALTRSRPLTLEVWRNLAGFKLSPTQREVAFWMALGGGRDAARARMSISEAVLRDCVKVVYERLGCSSQTELVAALRSAPQRALRS